MEGNLLPDQNTDNGERWAFDRPDMVPNILKLDLPAMFSFLTTPIGELISTPHMGRVPRLA